MIARIAGLATIVLAALAAAPAAAQETIAVTGDRLSGFVLPVEPLKGDIRLEALRAFAWTVDDTKRLLLDGDASVSIGAYRFSATSAVVWLNRIPSAGGLINQVAVYFADLEAPGGEEGIAARGKVLVTASARGEVQLDVALLEQRPPAGEAAALVRSGEGRLAQHLRGILERPPALRVVPRIEPLNVPPPVAPPEPGDPVEPAPAAGPAPHVTLPELGAAAPPIFTPGGTVFFSFGKAVLDAGTEERAALLTGGVVADAVSDSDTGAESHLTLSAQRAVVFLDPGSVEDLLRGSVPVDSIRGIYLEGAVVANANDGEYVVRAPRVYYDMRTGRALVLEAVLRTYSGQGRVPVYARAQEMRQLAADEWSADKATLSASEFAAPHLSLGASRVTITRRPRNGDPSNPVVHVTSSHNTLNVAGLPIAYWPSFSGTLEDLPLRGVSVGAETEKGVIVRTRWNPWSLLGIEQPEGVEGSVDLDGYTKRGPAAGLDLAYSRGGSRGLVELYGLHDDGVDRTSSGLDVTPDDQWRGVALWENQTDLSQTWSLQAQLSLISDETFITSWRERDFENRREYESDLLLQHLDDNVAFTFLGKYAVEDFISNSWLLASRAYQVDRLPEMAYRRYGDSLGDVVTYSGQTSLSRVRIVPQTGTPAELGVPGAAFGIGDNDSIAAALALPTQFVNRFDTRQEFSLPFSMGPVRTTPFVVGRLTAYDQDIDTTIEDQDTVRLFGAAGIRMEAQFQRVDDAAVSELFDIHRLRHLFEPRLVAWYGSSDVTDGTLPVYDQSVEAINAGSAVEFGVRNTLQTHRGGPGRWSSVDVFMIDASVVLDDNTTPTSPTPQFFQYRPEYSQFGDHVHATAIWLPSDFLSVTGEAFYNIDDGVFDRGSVGTELIHTPKFSTFIEYRLIQVDDTQLLDVGWEYWVTTKYQMRIFPQWDFVAGKFRAATLALLRRFPDFDFTLRLSYDEIADETSIGASIGLVEF